MSAVEHKMSEEQAVSLVRNALLVAGMEMGAEGDHWPVIKSTIHSIAKDWEDLKIERNVAAEVRKYYEGMMKDLDALRKGSSDAFKIDLDIALAELQTLYTACFSEVDQKNYFINEDEIPAHLNRAKVIMSTLEDENA